MEFQELNVFLIPNPCITSSNISLYIFIIVGKSARLLIELYAKPAEMCTHIT